MTTFDRRTLLKTTGIASATLAGVAPGVAAGRTPDGADEGGERIWSFETGGRVESGPTVVNETVFFGSKDGNVYAVDAETGAEQWRFETGEPPQDQEKAVKGVWGSVQVVDGTAYVGANDNYVYALDAETGEERWRYDTGRYVFFGSPTVVDGTVYGSSRSHRVFALDAETGEEEWRFRADGPVGGGVTVVDGSVYFGAYLEVNLYSVDAATGDLEWSYANDTSNCAAPAVYDGLVYSTFGNAPLFAFDADTGDVRWRYGDGFGDTEPPTVWNGTVYQAGESYVHAVEAATGERVWRFDSGWVNDVAPTVAGGVLFFGGREEPYLFAVDARTGEELWRFQTFEDARSSPMVVDGVVFFGSHDGYLHAVDAGVDGSSEDRRVELATEGHHHGWVGDPEPDLEMVAGGDEYTYDGSGFELPYGDWFDGVPNYQGTVDRRGEDTVTISVGAGDGKVFDSPAIIVDPHTEVHWWWTGRGGTHNVLEEDGAFESEYADERGHRYKRRFEDVGVYRYFCQPHEETGMKGAVVVGDIDEAVEDVRDPIRIVDAELDQTDATAGDVLGAAVRLENVDGEAHERALEVDVDGQAAASRTVSVPAKERTTVTVEFPVEEPGRYEVTVGDAVAGTVRVTAAGTSAGTTETTRGSSPATTRSATSGGAPGFGALGAVASLGGLGYLLKRLGGEDGE